MKSVPDPSCAHPPGRARAWIPLAGLLLLLVHAPAGARADALDDLLAGEAKRLHLPGVSVAVVRDGQVLRTAAFGFADLEHRVPVTPQTVFQIQSVTKTFTATAVLLLVEEGRLSLDDPVSRHLEGTPDAWRAITIRHLLNHTSGIKDFINEPTASLRLEVTEEDVLRATAPRPLNFPPGERYAYSNTSYHLLAMILRKLTGKGYGEVLQERILGPLGMARTRVVSLSDLVPDRACGYFWTGTAHRRGEFIAESILAYAGGGLLSTAPDLARWAQAMLEQRVLRPATRTQAWTPGRLLDGSSTSYGLGWGVTRREGHLEVGHTGAHATGFTSCLLLYPDDRLGVVVLQNAGGRNASLLARRIAGLYLPEVGPRPAPAIPDDAPDTAALVRTLHQRATEGTLEEARFTPELWKLLQSEKEEIRSQGRALGPLRSLELLSRTRSGDRTTSRYRTRFEHQSRILSLTLEGDGRISMIRTEDEE